MTNQPHNPNQDLDQITALWTENIQRSNRILSDFMARHAQQGPHWFKDEFGIQKAFLELGTKMMANPNQLVEAQMELWQNYMNLWGNTWMKLLGSQTGPSAPASGASSKVDKRFKHEDWEQNALFQYLKQSYLVTAEWLQHVVEKVEGLDESTHQKVSFYTRQFVDALSPSNFALTNPEVLRETLASGGKNLAKGFANLLFDLEQSEGGLKISMTDAEAFQFGVNIATTPGQVVYQNDLMQLIQYQPSTAEAYQKPLLIVPPWINKYYILDLRDKNSLVKWCVDQGFTVFMISWINPDERYANKDFSDYLLEGPIAALKAIEEATGAKSINTLGYCLGGTLLAATLGYLAEKKMPKGYPEIASASFMTTLIDFSEPGELGVFLDEQQITALEARMQAHGYLDGSEMANTFNLLRANDLIWSFVVNNYLLGREPLPFDLLYWNADSTRMPAKMHSTYLRKMYLHNALCQPGGLFLDGVAIDLSQVTTPLYFVSATDDHIAPWKTTYLGPALFKGPARFVLGGSGHIAGMINPPSANKYGYWTNENLKLSAEAWLKSAQQHEGSWWTDWKAWLSNPAQKLLGSKVPAPTPGSGKLKVIEPAPGSYVQIKSGKKASKPQK